MMTPWAVRLVETNRVPDWLIRLALRARLRSSLRRRYRASPEERAASKLALVHKLRQSPIALHTHEPNRQHYEVPSDFSSTVLGGRLMKSCTDPIWEDQQLPIELDPHVQLQLVNPRLCLMRILVIDQSEVFAGGLRYALRREGHRTVVAHDSSSVPPLT